MASSMATDGFQGIESGDRGLSQIIKRLCEAGVTN